MADQFTGTTTSGNLTGYGTVQAAYDALTRLPLRAELIYVQFANVRPTQQTAPGSSVAINFGADLSDATSALTEGADPDAVATSVTAVTVTLAEYGNVVSSTAKLRGTSYAAVDPDIAERIGRNAGSTLDQLGQNALDAGSNTMVAADVATTALSGGTAAHYLTAAEVRQARNNLRSGNAKQMRGMGAYVGIIHPDQYYDLSGETGAGAWRTPREYADPSDIYMAEAGFFEGFRFFENTRVKVEADAGSGTSDVYTANFLGDEALAMVHSIRDGNSPMPSIVIKNGSLDKLDRFNYIGWKWLGGFGEARSAANVLMHTASSLSPAA
jgi:N4-gp56 family major capsid protein